MASQQTQSFPSQGVGAPVPSQNFHPTQNQGHQNFGDPQHLQYSGASAAGGSGAMSVSAPGVNTQVARPVGANFPPQQQGAQGQGQGQGQPGVNNGNMYAQLETMMTAVRQEAKALEVVKKKIKEMDGLRIQVGELRGKLEEAEQANQKLASSLEAGERVSSQLRADMQSLNDIYYKEHTAYGETQQMVAKLEHDLRNAANEMGFYQKEAQRIPDLRKKNQALASQIGVLQKQAEEEKAISAQTTAALEEKLAAAAATHAEHTQQFWSIVEENKKLKQEIAHRDQAHGMGDAKMRAVEEKVAVSEAREQMRFEDHLAFLQRDRLTTNKLTADLAGARAEADSLRDILNHKEDASIALHAKLRNIEEARQAEKGEVKGKIAALTETISVLKSKNHELEREASEAQHRLGLMGGDVSRYTMEVEHLQSELSRGDVAKQQREAEFQRKLDLSLKEKEDALDKLRAASQNFEAMQAQARDGQARYWEELQRVKEAEAQLSEEADKLAQELEEKSAKLIMVEAERAKLEEYMRGEVSGAMQMTAALRGELERRLEELSHARKERDESFEEQKKTDDRIAEMQKMMERQESNFKKALETDRNKISSEIKSKMQKLRGLEIEKQELLMETSNLMKQVESTQKELTQARNEVEQSRTAAREATRRVGELVDQNEMLQKSTNTAVLTQDELREHANRLETSFKEDIGRLDTLVKESKKAAAQQVLEITERVRHAQEEAEMARTQLKFAAENEKKALDAAETVRTQMGIAAKSHEEMQQQMAKDMTTMRRELQDYRNKQKIGAESRTKMEVETMNARMEATKAENEVLKMTEIVRDMEAKMAQSLEESQKIKTERNELDREHKKLKMRAVDLEETVTKKTTANEMLTKDMAKLEREGLVETRRLRLALQVAEQELGELKSTMPLLQKELLDGKRSFDKIQSSTNETVNGLLEELRNTEDALSAERKKNQHEVDVLRRNIQEVTANLDKANAHIHENMTRGIAAHNDKEMRVMQLEQELERIKQHVIQKESRMNELEKQHQADRTRIHEIKEQLENAERSIMDGKTTIEIEQAQRKRLEARLRVVLEAEKEKDNVSLSALTPRTDIGARTVNDASTFGAGAGLFSPSTIEKRTKMLYGDVDDMAEPEFDDVRSSYQLDAGSALAAIGAADDDTPNPNKSTPLAKKKLRQIIATGIAGDDDDFMAEKANNPRIGGTGGERDRDRDRDREQGRDRDRDRGQAPYNHLEVSGGFSAEDSFSKGNPVVDRVTQALAARAAAESSKADLRQAQQQNRNLARVAKANLDLALASGGQGSPDESRPGSTGGRPTSTGGRSSKVRDVREMVTSASTSVLESETDMGAPTTDIEDSIQRTQMFLRQRLAQRASGGGGAGAKAAAVETTSSRASYGDNPLSEAEQAQIAAREAQRIAEQAYQRHGRQAVGSASSSVPGGEENSENNISPSNESGPNLKAPHLSPAKPINSVNGGYSRKNLSSTITYEDEENSEEPTRLPHIHRGTKGKR